MLQPLDQLDVMTANQEHTLNTQAHHLAMHALQVLTQLAQVP
jgi:hypothetical protein